MTLALLSGHGTLDQLLGSYGYAAVLASVAVESLGVPFPVRQMLIDAALYISQRSPASCARQLCRARRGRPA